MATSEPPRAAEPPLGEDTGAIRTVSDPQRAERRRFLLSVIGLSVLLVVLVGAYLLLRKSQEYDPTVAGGRIVLYAVLSLNIVLILAIAVTVFRNVFKLFFEWRRDIMGSRFSIKLVAAFLAQGIIPTAMLFLAGSELIKINTAQWFSTDVDTVTDSALRIAQRHREHVDAQLMDKARELADELGREGLLELDRRRELVAAMRDMLVRHHLGGLTVFLPGVAPVEVIDPSRLPMQQPEVPNSILMRWQRGERFARNVELMEGGGAVKRSGAPVVGESGETLGMVMVSVQVDPGLARDEQRVTSAREEFKRREISKGFIVATNVSILLLVTLLVLLAAVWMGLVMARGITEPIQRLAEGTRAISTGDLDHRVATAAGDELRVLVDSFNRMTTELKASKVALEHSMGELRASNDELAERRMFIETVLDNVAAGVLTWDREGRLTTQNPAANRILRLGGDLQGRPVAEVLERETFEGLRSLVESTRAGSGPQDLQLTVVIGTAERVLQAFSSPLISAKDGSLSGVVLVIEDVSDLVKAQKASAWREVARRMAHEIKNPLTPIQISAERVLMKVSKLDCEEEAATALRDCGRIILEEVRTLKSLVDEFSRFARLPQVALRPGDLNEVVRSAVALYEKVVPPGRFRVELSEQLDPISLDPEQMKRAVVNLVDNALVAMGNEGVVSIRTRYEGDRGQVCLEVADEGPGIPPQVRPKLFLPHFSTKKRGTGLGLAIVDRVVSDHGGYIRVEENQPRGARFIIEIPLRSAAARSSA